MPTSTTCRKTPPSRRGDQTFPSHSKEFQTFSKQFQAFSKEIPNFSKVFQIYSLAVLNEIKALTAAPAGFGLRGPLGSNSPKSGTPAGADAAARPN
ncbi:MAG: hypothetical protein ABSC25_16250 [Roseiarcus sp.]|jgi:hypothetical protein